MADKLEILIDGEWLPPRLWDELEWSSCFPGGSDALQFDPAKRHPLFRVDAVVELKCGGVCLWCGTMLDPTPGQPIVAEGLWRKATTEPGVDGVGNDATLNVGSAVDWRIAFGGIRWEWPDPSYRYVTSGTLNPPSGAEVALDLDRPHTLAALMDAAALERHEEWGVDPATRQPFMAPWPTTPTLHMLPGISGLGISRDGYKSRIFARYLDSTSSTYKTVIGIDAAAEKRWGYVPDVHPELLGEGTAMTAARAQELVDGLIAQGASQVGWTTPLEVELGDIVDEYMQAVPLVHVSAGQVIRLHGLVEDVADLDGQSWRDMPIRRVTHRPDGSVLLEPRGLVQPMNDAIAGMTP